MSSNPNWFFPLSLVNSTALLLLSPSPFFTSSPFFSFFRFLVFAFHLLSFLFLSVRFHSLLSLPFFLSLSSCFICFLSSCACFPSPFHSPRPLFPQMSDPLELLAPPGSPPMSADDVGAGLDARAQVRLAVLATARHCLTSHLSFSISGFPSLVLVSFHVTDH